MNKMLNSKSIGQKIAEARKRMSLSQAELSQKWAISPQAVGKWERGESMPDIATLNRLAEILGVDLNYFSDQFHQRDVSAPLPERQAPQPTEAPSGSRRQLDWNWDMSQGKWSDADFSGLRNLKEKFSSSNLKNCKFLHSDLSGLVLEKNNIELCDFSGSDIRDSHIRSSNILKNQFGGCSFIDAKFFKNNVEACHFDGADFSGTELLKCNLEHNSVKDVVWKFTKFHETNLSQMVLSGAFEDCHFEHCAFYGVRFENATIRNTFFKYNERFRKVQFVNCSVDNITLAFLKNNQANLSGITLLQ